MLLKDVHPSYISWGQYEENLQRLRDNAYANGQDRRKSPPREGPALLQGLVVRDLTVDLFQQWRALECPSRGYPTPSRVPSLG
jgi:hypothetical protein